MLLGPVFRAELMQIARRGRYYLLRFTYGSLLLLLVWSGYEARFRGVSTATIAAVSGFAQATFVSFAIMQLLTLLILIPPLFGGAIAGEKQRKTLHYLMASPLSSSEIIVDKVLGRLPLVGIFMAIGLPVVSILGLFGGIPAEYVIIAYVGTISTAAFAVALTILVSTFARRVRGAVLLAYVLVWAWFFVPTAISFCAVVIPGTGTYYQWISPINEWLRASSPFSFSVMGVMRPLGPRGGLGALWVQFEWMVGLQLGGAALLLLLASWRLRPTFRHQEETSERRSRFAARGSRRRRWLARPDCGHDGVLWKERYFAPSDLLTKLVLVPAVAIVTLPLALLTATECGIYWVVHSWLAGFTAHRFVWGDDFIWILGVDFGWYCAFWLLAIAGGAASSVTTEREAVTWVSLTSTPLTGWQIVRGKALGAIWNQRGFGVVLILIWFVGLVAGALNPLGILASVAVVGVLTWFVAALGIRVSLRADTTSRALVTTIAALCVFNGYPLLFLYWFFDSLSWNSSFSLLGAFPWLASRPLVSYRFVFVHGLWTTLASRQRIPVYDIPLVLGLLAVYVLIAGLLTFQVVGRFDRCLDRPRKSRSRVPEAACKGGPRRVTGVASAEPTSAPVE